MMRRIPFLVAIAFCLVACEPEDLRVLSTITSGGGSAPVQPAAPAQPETITPPPTVMTTQFTEPASANSQRDAMRECSEIADRYVQRGRNVTFVNIKRAVQGGGWICVFEEN